jgi:hypothetical protein
MGGLTHAGAREGEGAVTPAGGRLRRGGRAGGLVIEFHRLCQTAVKITGNNVPVIV